MWCRWGLEIEAGGQRALASLSSIWRPYLTSPWKKPTKRPAARAVLAGQMEFSYPRWDEAGGHEFSFNCSEQLHLKTCGLFLQIFMCYSSDHWNHENLNCEKGWAIVDSVHRLLNKAYCAFVPWHMYLRVYYAGVRVSQKVSFVERPEHER